MNTLTSLYHLAEKNGIAVDCFQLQTTPSLSIVDETGQCHIALDPFQMESETQELLLLAHEMGHCATGAYYNRYTPFDIRQKHENRARRWAYRYLLTPEHIQEALSHGCEEVWQIADYWSLPPAFVAAALQDWQQENEREKKKGLSK